MDEALRKDRIHAQGNFHHYRESFVVARLLRKDIRKDDLYLLEGCTKGGMTPATRKGVHSGTLRQRILFLTQQIDVETLPHQSWLVLLEAGKNVKNDSKNTANGK